VSNLIKIRPAVLEFLHAEKQTGTAKLTGAFLQLLFANKSKNSHISYLIYLSQ
jgi:hypothetical protein